MTPQDSVAQAINASLAISSRRLIDLRLHQLPSLCATTSQHELTALQADLTATLEAVRGQLQEAKLEAADVEHTEERSQVVLTLAQLQRDYDELQSEARTALLAGRRHVASTKTAAARRELGLDKANQSRSVGDDKLTTASSDVTSALQRTVALMSTELQKSSYSAQLLDESSGALQSIGQEYASFGEVLRNSGTLIRSMERQDLIDAGILAASALFFVLCIAYIVKVRVWDRGVSLVSFFWRILTFAGAHRADNASSLTEQLSAASSAARASQSAIATSAASLTESITQAAQAAATTAVAFARAIDMQQQQDPAPAQRLQHVEL